jgi:hypothetical protein
VQLKSLTVCYRSILKAGFSAHEGCCVQNYDLYFMNLPPRQNLISLKVAIALLAAISELEFPNINLVFPLQLPKRPPLFLRRLRPS